MKPWLAKGYTKECCPDAKKAIGGYFELELSGEGNGLFHDSAVAVNTGRNALELILKTYAVKKLWLPYYICDSILQPLKKLKIEHEFYHIDNTFQPAIDLDFEGKEFGLYVNYFGIKDRFVEDLITRSNVIIDNSQAFFNVLRHGALSFYSSRKYFGVPDGGFAYCDDGCKDVDLVTRDNSYERVSHLMKRLELGAEEGFSDFRKNEEALDQQEISRMSYLTDRLLRGVDYERARSIRVRNFDHVHDALRNTNQLAGLCDTSTFACPMVYPYLSDNEGMYDYLMERRIYAARYWPNVLKWLKNAKGFEEDLVKNMVAIPIDQRYGLEDMDRIIETIEAYNG